MEVTEFDSANFLCLRRWHQDEEALIFLNFSATAVTITPKTSHARWKKILDSSDRHWHGPGAPQNGWPSPGSVLTLNRHSIVLYRKDLSGENA
jgi:hypothetical protein